MAEARFCPKCGAYWSCNCSLEEFVFVPDANCDHDWAEVVGVELEEGVGSGTGRVFGCRLCGRLAPAGSTEAPW